MTRRVKLKSPCLPNRMAGGFASTRTASAQSSMRRRLAEISQVGSSSPSSMACPRRRRSSFLLACSPTTCADFAFHLLDRVAFFGFLSTQFRLDKHVDVAIHHGLHVAGLGAGAVVFHHLIWLKYVRANLISPRDLAFLAVLPLYLAAFLVFFELIKLCFQHFHRQLAIAPLAALSLAGNDDSSRFVQDSHRG